MRKKANRLTAILGVMWLACVVACPGAESSGAATLAPRPPMGWNSFDGYGVYLHEKAAMANLESMAAKLKAHGYEYFVIDNGWFGEYALQPGTIYASEKHAHDVAINEFGLFQPSKVYFPHGLKPIIDRCHELGLKFGVHLMRGIPRKAVKLNLPIKGTDHRGPEIADQAPERNCKWCTYNYGVDMSKPGAQEFYNSLINQLAEWGVDFIKYDDIVPYPLEVKAVAKAIADCGRPMVLSLSPGNNADPENIDAFRTANMLRVTRDVWDDQKDIDACFDAWRKWYGKAKPGFWIDMDMIPFGRLQLMSPRGKNPNPMKKGDIALSGKGTTRQCQLSKLQMETFITLRALSASPLMMGGDLPTLDDFSLKLITDPDMIACNQNGIMGHVVYEKDGIEVWNTPQKGKDDEGWLGIFNRSEDPAEVTLGTANFGLAGKKAYKMKNVWRDRVFLADKKHKIPAHGVVFIRYE
ncbi:MAG: glycoside hydrolase family 27 protein [Kiritimatiellia bacterium]|jgi:hypothetical protein|nr:glycoside hydrolase family 27 protein [Kiritimatiellia bacterium]MDP6847533.1 glycoside hydrolase family 27 protein [Kiritimatiellia bacterium]